MKVFAKYIFDVFFDIPQDVLASLPKGKPLSGIVCSEEIDRIDISDNTDEDYSGIRMYCSGTDAGCQQRAKRMKIKIGNQTFKAVSNEIIHCQRV